jgi:hypothetical protein
MRAILRAPRYAAIVIVTVAGAVAIAASVFGVANVVLRPDPSIRDPVTATIGLVLLAAVTALVLGRHSSAVNPATVLRP